ncbi:hypothetical protein DPMN_084795 [Dreissena polymorpha]|uniref:Uncharacterized protein n=1 Tax=Dreissena polymorpha TaxID=45954 RepID=A0A9D4BJQ6_DREPO|nr:hypothetical protein DPMN_084795 [Dreissena polymorpha]
MCMCWSEHFEHKTGCSGGFLQHKRDRNFISKKAVWADLRDSPYGSWFQALVNFFEK